jgi:AraC family transcriptional regulator
MENVRYEDRINRAIALIDRDLDKNLSLERLADEACLSAFHFHRLFSMLTGESVHALTTRMRMQRALALTARGAKPQWKQIASAAGYRSPDVFARAFKRHYGCAPSRFDLASWWQERPDRDEALAVSQYFLRPAPPLPADFVVSIEHRPAAELMVSRATGAYTDPARMIAAYERIKSAAAGLGVPLAKHLSGSSQDDPELVPLSRCRYDFALEVLARTPVPKTLLPRHRPEGRWATTRVEGGLDAVDRAWNLLFKSWLPRSGYNLRDAPAEEIYRETPETIGWERFDLTLAIPLED